MVDTNGGQDPVRAAVTAPVPIPESYNYIGVFLTLRCNLRCSYCLNRFGGLAGGGRELRAEEWLRGLNRLQSREDLPLTLQGGEPTLHPDFYRLVTGLRPEFHLDLLTNLQFEVREFMARIPPSRFRRSAPYASIRVSYHPESMKVAELKAKVATLLAGGYSVGIWAVNHPAWSREIEAARAACVAEGIDFRVKEFLGLYQGRMHGAYRYEGAVANGAHRRVECRGSELLLDPAGNIHGCHGDLYGGREPLGNLLDRDLRLGEEFRPCASFGACNPCDVKIKTNRFQEFGHTSVEIRFPEAESAPAGPAGRG